MTENIKIARGSGAKAMTANRLREGDVVYLARGNRWVERFSEAWIARSPEEEAEMTARAEAAVAARQVVAIYLLDVVDDENAPRPLSQREIIRAKGPTVRLDLGKQADGRA
ncbi:MAG: DUF2849 domain-containing protein [Kiloniellales bacterium]